MTHHLQWGHRQLTRCVEGDVAPSLFVNKSTGLPLKPQEVGKLWSDTVLEGSGVHFSPHMCRSIFVCGTKDLNMPMKEGMSMVMGSSHATICGAIYDKHFNNRQAQEAMDAMPLWRATMLKEARNTPPSQGFLPKKRAKHTHKHV